MGKKFGAPNPSVDLFDRQEFASQFQFIYDNHNHFQRSNDPWLLLETKISILSSPLNEFYSGCTARYHAEGGVSIDTKCFSSKDHEAIEDLSRTRY